MWMDWLARWAVIGGLSLVDAAWLWARGTDFEFGALDGRIRIAGTYLAFCVVCTFAVRRMRRLSPIVAKVSDYFYSSIQMLLLVPPAVTLTYLAATVNAPLVDGTLLRADELVGFDWHALDSWVGSHTWIAAALRGAYWTLAMAASSAPRTSAH